MVEKFKFPQKKTEEWKNQTLSLNYFLFPCFQKFKVFNLKAKDIRKSLFQSFFALIFIYNKNMYAFLLCVPLNFLFIAIKMLLKKNKKEKKKFVPHIWGSVVEYRMYAIK